MCHKETCSKEEARVDFFQAIAECMVNSNTNWHEYEQSSTAASNLLRDSEVQEGETHDSTCRPVHLNNLPFKLSTKIKLCQVCKYELRKQQWKSVTLCPKHGVWLCTEVCQERRTSLPTITKRDGSAVIDWSWTCDTMDSYWNKFHTFTRHKDCSTKSSPLHPQVKWNLLITCTRHHCTKICGTWNPSNCEKR